jgi:CubicO group peptidase (beta-lactamase class C family)
MVPMKKIFFAFGILLLAIAPLGAQKPTPPPAQMGEAIANTMPPNEGHQLTAADADVFLDGLVPALLEHNDVAGAVIMIVKDGKVLYANGYGYSDVKTKKPVSVDDTLFRPGSISKLFTCTAVMQLVEQGKLDLDRDVNDYLDFKIPATYAQPVTLRRIMTHTAGFEEWGKDLFVPTAADLEPIGEVLPNHLPARVFAPGTMPAYSNYAMTIAGYIVQRISGEKFEDYIANHIYKPLGIVHSTFVQPLPADLKPLMSSGYALASGGAKEFEFVNSAPAGSMTTSAGDIAKFMIAHLQDGRYGDVQILKPETAKLMHSRAFGPVPELNGMALAFFQENQNGHTIIGHGGDTRYFHSHLHLILDANVGLFISLNSAGRGDVDIRGTVFKKFIDRYFPPTPPLPPAIATAATDANLVAGNYITSRRGETNFLKMNAIMVEVQFAALPDGAIVSSQIRGPNGQPRHYREIAPLVYRAEDGEARLGFVKQSDGLYYIFTSGAASGFQQVTFLESVGFVTALRNFALAVLGLTVALWPIGALIRWHYGRKLNVTGADRRWPMLTRFVCAFDLALVYGWSLYSNASGPTRTDASLDFFLTMLQILGWVGAIATIIVLVNALRSWRAPHRWVLSKFGDTVTLLGCVAFIWFACICRFLHVGTRF